MRRTRHPLVQVLLLAAGMLTLLGCSSSLKPWHSVELDLEYTARESGNIETLDDYLALENSVFNQLDEEIYDWAPTGPEYSLQRYSPSSAADPRSLKPNWNRSFELGTDKPRGGILLLHGMSDSPYSLRALGQSLNRQGFQVVGLRLPGHGTAPAGMTSIHWEDLAAVTALGMRHLADKVGDQPVHIIGYSTGAALALDYAMEASPDQQATSLILISPAIGIHPTAALASWKRRFSALPGMKDMAWLQLEEEFDPYKYNSFATNAAEQVHRLTRSVGDRAHQRSLNTEGLALPPTLVFKSTVDATVSNDALLDRLLLKLAPGDHELVLFDINRFAPTKSLMIQDPGPFTDRLVGNRKLPFSLSLVSNGENDSRGVSVFYKPPFTRNITNTERLDLEWPTNVLSLSHVALPFPPDDPLYGRFPPEDKSRLFLGDLPLRGERDLLAISGDFLLRLRHNPFYEYLEKRTSEWVAGNKP